MFTKFTNFHVACEWHNVVTLKISYQLKFFLTMHVNCHIDNYNSYAKNLNVCCTTQGLMEEEESSKEKSLDKLHVGISLNLRFGFNRHNNRRSLLNSSHPCCKSSWSTMHDTKNRKKSRKNFLTFLYVIYATKIHYFIGTSTYNSSYALVTSVYETTCLRKTYINCVHCMELGPSSLRSSPSAQRSLLLRRTSRRRRWTKETTEVVTLNTSLSLTPERLPVRSSPKAVASKPRHQFQL